MKKSNGLLASSVVCLALVSLCLYVKKSHADGTSVYAPGPVIAATGAFYAYPGTASPTPGGTLVNDGTQGFKWSNTVVTATTSLTVTQFPALPLLTAAQIAALQASTTGQMVFCTNCASGGAKGVVCISTGSTLVNQFALSTGTLCN